MNMDTNKLNKGKKRCNNIEILLEINMQTASLKKRGGGGGNSVTQATVVDRLH